MAFKCSNSFIDATVKSCMSKQVTVQINLKYVPYGTKTFENLFENSKLIVYQRQQTIRRNLIFPKLI
jgi:hypothetical protein